MTDQPSPYDPGSKPPETRNRRSESGPFIYASGAIAWKGLVFRIVDGKIRWENSGKAGTVASRRNVESYEPPQRKGDAMMIGDRIWLDWMPLPKKVVRVNPCPRVIAYRQDGNRCRTVEFPMRKFRWIMDDGVWSQCLAWDNVNEVLYLSWLERMDHP